MTNARTFMAHLHGMTAATIDTSDNYRPQTKFGGKIMFLHLSVSHSVHRGVCVTDTAQANTPRQTSPR